MRLRGSAGWVLAGALLLAPGCGSFLAQCEREIQAGERDLAAARDDAARARALDRRGRGYAEMARFSWVSKQMSAEEGGRLFTLALQDLDRAQVLAPGDGRILLDRGRTCFDWAALQEGGQARGLLARARADYAEVLRRDPANAEAQDFCGLCASAAGDLDAAIQDWTALQRLDARLGRLRLAEAYCRRGEARAQARDLDRAIADFEASIGMGASADGCDCQPDGPLAGLYLERGQYDQCWQVVRRARAARRWIEPELVERLRKESGRRE